MTLREQIEALPSTGTTDEWNLEGIHRNAENVERQAVLDIIDRHRCDERYETFTAADGEISIRKHRCLPDRDALALALDRADGGWGDWDHISLEMREVWLGQADTIIAALEANYAKN